jgi:uncharacterized YccA/Bax inhibitor family protein
MRLRTINPALTAPSYAELRGTLVAPAAGMTVAGVAGKTALLLVVLLAAGASGWQSSLSWTGVIGASIGTALLGGLVRARPARASLLAWPYVALQGFLCGSLSQACEAKVPGVVRDAMVATLGVLITMLLIYRLRLIRLDRNFHAMVATAIGGLATVYLVTFALSLFGVRVFWLHEGSWWAIALSLYAVTAAALNLVCDFDHVEQAITAGTPKRVEWYAAFGLLVSLVWLYFEILRLLIHLRKRR